MKNIKKIIENVDRNDLYINTADDLDLLGIELEEDDDDNNEKNDIIKCGTDTDPNSLAYYIATQFEQNPDCIIIQTIGPKALSKAIFAIIRLKSLVAPYIDGSTLVSRFSVRKLQLPNGAERTAIRIRIFPIPDKFAI